MKREIDRTLQTSALCHDASAIEREPRSILSGTYTQKAQDLLVISRRVTADSNNPAGKRPKLWLVVVDLIPTGICKKEIVSPRDHFIRRVDHDDAPAAQRIDVLTCNAS